MADVRTSIDGLAARSGVHPQEARLLLRRIHDEVLENGTAVGHRELGVFKRRSQAETWKNHADKIFFFPARDRVILAPPRRSSVEGWSAVASDPWRLTWEDETTLNTFTLTVTPDLSSIGFDIHAGTIDPVWQPAQPIQLRNLYFGQSGDKIRIFWEVGTSSNVRMVYVTSVLHNLASFEAWHENTIGSAYWNSTNDVSMRLLAKDYISDAGPIKTFQASPDAKLNEASGNTEHRVLWSAWRKWMQDVPYVQRKSLATLTYTTPS